MKRTHLVFCLMLVHQALLRSGDIGLTIDIKGHVEVWVLQLPVPLSLE